MRLSYVLLRKVPVRLHRLDMVGTQEVATLNDDCITWCDGGASGGSGGGGSFPACHTLTCFFMYFFPPSINSPAEHLDTKTKSLER